MRRLATKTLAAIDGAIKADQGAAYRGWLAKVLPNIGDAYRTENEPFRSHLGASLLGRECAREIWYNFRWAYRSNFDGRMVRLFNRGHLEEGRFIAMLLTIGCEVYQQDENGKQFRISFAEGHAGGSGDGIVVGLPDLPAGQAALCEFKTHNDKSFKELETKGVQEAKPEHYVQMNIYMYKMGIPVCLYLSVNKNTDAVYGEIVTLEREIAEQYIERGDKLVWMQEPPKRLSETPGFWKCKFCVFKQICHWQEEPDLNCRTCEYSEPRANGEWYCRYWNSNIPKENQLTGCTNYIRKENF